MKKLLVIGYVWPEPNSSAAGSRMLDILQFFIKHHWEITFSSPAQQTAHQFDLATLGIKQQTIALNCGSFDNFVEQLNPNAVLFDRFMMEEQFGWRVARMVPNAIRILESSDLHLLRNARQQSYKKGQQLKTSDLYSEMAQREIAAIYRCDLTLIISQYEVKLLEEQFSLPKQLIHYLPFFIDSHDIPNELPSFFQRRHFITIGNFRHPPNWDSVLWLQQAIWPSIRQALPDTELHIYGAYPPKKATQLHNPKTGFLVKGWTDDAAAVLKAARVLLAPLRFGAGLKGKLFDAMVCGTPSITTSIGAEGMTGNQSWCGEIEDKEEQFINSAIKLYNNQAQWDQHQLQGVTLLKNHFDKEKHEQALCSRLAVLDKNLDQERGANFIGKMLNHHHHRSTEYMSRWIEEKNNNIPPQPPL